MKTLPSNITALIGKTITAFTINQTTAKTVVWRGDLVEIEKTDTACILARIGVSDGKRRRNRSFFIRPYTLLFAGDCPHITDGEVAQAQANFPVRDLATLNLSGSVPQLRKLIDKHNLNPLFTAHDRIMAFQPPFSELTPVYPEVPSTHAAVRALREQSFRTQKP